MRNPYRDPGRAPDRPYPAVQPDAAVTAAPDGHRPQIGQLPARELDMYGHQLARCLQALGTSAPIRADIQREFAAVRAEQDSRASIGKPARSPDVSALTLDELHRTRRELQASLALSRPGSPTRRLIQAHLTAIGTELGEDLEPAAENGLPKGVGSRG